MNILSRRNHSPSHIGAISETKVELDLLRKGFNVLLPSVPTRYDRLVEVGEGTYVRVQVKTARVDKRDGNLRVTYEFPYDESQIDVIAVYDPTNDDIYYVPIDHISNDSKGFTIRVTERKNKRKTGGLAAGYYKDNFTY